MSGTQTDVEALSFEDAMKRLEQVVGQLERGDVPLEEAIDLYQLGARLKKHCEARLNAAQEKVAALMIDAEGTPAGLKVVEGL